MSQHLQIIYFLKEDNKYKKGQIDRQIDIKEEKKCLIELIIEIEKGKIFKKNE